MVLDPISQSLPVHFFGSRPQPPTSPCVFLTKVRRHAPTHMCVVVTTTKKKKVRVYVFVKTVTKMCTHTHVCLHDKSYKDKCGCMCMWKQSPTHPHTHTHVCLCDKSHNDKHPHTRVCVSHTRVCVWLNKSQSHVCLMSLWQQSLRHTPTHTCVFMTKKKSHKDKCVYMSLWEKSQRRSFTHTNSTNKYSHTHVCLCDISHEDTCGCISLWKHSPQKKKSHPKKKSQGQVWVYVFVETVTKTCTNTHELTNKYFHTHIYTHIIPHALGPPFAQDKKKSRKSKSPSEKVKKAWTLTHEHINIYSQTYTHTEDTYNHTFNTARTRPSIPTGKEKKPQKQIALQKSQKGQQVSREARCRFSRTHLEQISWYTR